MAALDELVLGNRLSVNKQKRKQEMLFSMFQKLSVHYLHLKGIKSAIAI